LEDFFIYNAFSREINPDQESRMIGHFEGGVSHAMVIFQHIDGLWKVLHSAGNGVEVIPLSQLLDGKRELVYIFRVKSMVSQEFFSKCADKRSGLKVKYATKQFVNQAFRLLGIKWVPFRNGDASTICCEEQLIANRYSEAWPELIELDQDRIGVNDMVKEFRSISLAQEMTPLEFLKTIEG
jgi:hypothetical protein